MKDFKLVGNHPQDLAGGRMLAPGEEVSLSAEEVREPHNAALIAEGVLMDISSHVKKGSEDK